MNRALEIARFLAKRPERWTCLVEIIAPVGYLEGIYVEPDRPTNGVGRALMGAGEEWARSKGCTEMASDRDLTDEESAAFHEAIGFRETTRMVCYRKAVQ